MKRNIIFGICGCLGLLMSACGGQDPVDDNQVKARNLKTGAIESFASAEAVPDDYIVCDTPDCPVPSDVPCAGLGATVCESHPQCKVQVIACFDETNPAEPVPPAEGVDTASDADNGAEPGDASDAYPEPGGSGEPMPTQLCEVACVDVDTLFCEDLTDPQQCAARPECMWDEICPLCGCQDGQECDCAECTGVCVTAPKKSCFDLATEEQCAANPECSWEEYCPDCMCNSDTPCECECGQACLPAQKDDCVDMTTEQECLADPLCEWGQFICPPCIFDEPSGEPTMCDCGLSCRAKEQVCPPVPMPAIGCEDGSALEPVMDPMGCVVGWKCPQAPLVCAADADGALCPPGYTCTAADNDPSGLGICVKEECAPVMCEIACANGFAVDENGCEICQCKPEEKQCRATGCSGQLCAAEDLISTCEWVDYYACYDLAVCGLAEDGACGWIPTPEFEACMTAMGQ